MSWSSPPLTRLLRREIVLGWVGGLPVTLNNGGTGRPGADSAPGRSGRAYGFGRNIHVGETALGIKGRIGFEAGAALLLIAAHRELEKLVLTKWQTFWKDQLARFYGDRLHEGHYFDPALRDIEAMITSSQQRVTGRDPGAAHAWTLPGGRRPQPLLDDGPQCRHLRRGEPALDRETRPVPLRESRRFRSFLPLGWLGRETGRWSIVDSR